MGLLVSGTVLSSRQRLPLLRRQKRSMPLVELPVCAVPHWSTPRVPRHLRALTVRQSGAPGGSGLCSGLD